MNEERRRETSAAFSLSGGCFARVDGRSRVSPRRVDITGRAAPERQVPANKPEVSESLPETRARVMAGLSPVERAQPRRLRARCWRNPVRAIRSTLRPVLDRNHRVEKRIEPVAYVVTNYPRREWGARLVAFG